MDSRLRPIAFCVESLERRIWSTASRAFTSASVWTVATAQGLACSLLSFRSSCMLVVGHNDYVRRIIRLDQPSVRRSWISSCLRVQKGARLIILLKVGSVRSGCRKLRPCR